MNIDQKNKEDIINEFRIHEKDTGSVEYQIINITFRVNTISKHLKEHKQDIHSRTGLLNMISRRKRLIAYLHRKNPEKYESLIRKLNIRK